MPGSGIHLGERERLSRFRPQFSVLLGVNAELSHGIWLAAWLLRHFVVSSSSLAGAGADSAGRSLLRKARRFCTADFVVSDSSGKGVYDAKIGIQIKYGFLAFISSTSRSHEL